MSISLKKNLKAWKIRNLKDTQAVFWPSVMMLWRGNFQKKRVLFLYYSISFTVSLLFGGEISKKNRVLFLYFSISFTVSLLLCFLGRNDKIAYSNPEQKTKNYIIHIFHNNKKLIIYFFCKKNVIIKVFRNTQPYFPKWPFFWMLRLPAN